MNFSAKRYLSYSLENWSSNPLKGKEKDMASQIHAFEKQVSKLIHLKIEDEKVLKQVLHNLNHKIEVFEGGKIKIHFNFINPVAKMWA
jgi:hypothetical protein